MWRKICSSLGNGDLVQTIVCDNFQIWSRASVYRGKMLKIPDNVPKHLVEELEAYQKQLRILFSNYQVIEPTIYEFYHSTWPSGVSYHALFLLQILKKRKDANPEVSCWKRYLFWHYFLPLSNLLNVNLLYRMPLFQNRSNRSKNTYYSSIVNRYIASIFIQKEI